MKKLVLLLCIVQISTAVFTQSLWTYPLDSMKRALANAKNDEARLLSLLNLFYRYAWSSPDSASPYAQQYMMLAQNIGSNELLVKAYGNYAILADLTGNFPQALDYGLKSLSFAEKTKDFLATASAYSGIGEAYLSQGDVERAIFYTAKANAVIDAIYPLPPEKPSSSNDSLDRYASTAYSLCKAYLKARKTDSVLKYINVVDWIWGKEGTTINIRWPTIPFMLGNVHFQKGDYATANKYYHEGIVSAKYFTVDKDLMDILNGLALSHDKLHQWDSAVYYAREVLRVSETAKNQIIKLEALTLLASVFKTKNSADSSAKYFELALIAKDSLFNQSKQVQMQNSTFNEQLRRQEIAETERRRTYRYRLYALGMGIVFLLTLLINLYRNNRHKQKAKIKIEQAYDHLKAAQQQLIQSEKMASLGELTAGIAHEIQNPLNFVNNFSEVNNELLTELKDEIDKGNFTEVKSIANDVMENHEKINHHGKRAETIVKGMLQHSRTSSGQKEPTDINALAEEHLRLAFHGLRAKDKAFNAKLETDFDQSIEKINVVPQDIGRVILNLINNAFHSLGEKQKEQIAGYEAAVKITTRRIADEVEIRVTDNGTGIPQKVVDKIFQPFFTTKPAGQGTGLGLSLSYDIVRVHSGELTVETKEGEGSEFIIRLPLI